MRIVIAPRIVGVAGLELIRCAKLQAWIDDVDPFGRDAPLRISQRHATGGRAHQTLVSSRPELQLEPDAVLSGNGNDDITTIGRTDVPVTLAVRVVLLVPVREVPASSAESLHEPHPAIRIVRVASGIRVMLQA